MASKWVADLHISECDGNVSLTMKEFLDTRTWLNNQKEKWVNDRKSKKKHITPKSEAQQLALESFEYNKVTVCSGAIASGKSAVALS